jgi:hypothetical protein
MIEVSIVQNSELTTEDTEDAEEESVGVLILVNQAFDAIFQMQAVEVD